MDKHIQKQRPNDKNKGTPSNIKLPSTTAYTCAACHFALINGTHVRASPVVTSARARIKTLFQFSCRTVSAQVQMHFYEVEIMVSASPAFRVSEIKFRPLEPDTGCGKCKLQICKVVEVTCSSYSEEINAPSVSSTGHQREV
ncbi:hypothetical protein AVEN_110937-1 [Araneus ventricosus]|uniref:Uncharacterized protein n=1 Tax=Araneus ventricosus TaxID=182803 RepID=A0A4Y2HD74_ARAVE|nr:hypothetical protein AVEN_110937-1 [Araneus ventricosus]